VIQSAVKKSRLCRGISRVPIFRKCFVTDFGSHSLRAHALTLRCVPGVDTTFCTPKWARASEAVQRSTPSTKPRQKQVGPGFIPDNLLPFVRPSKSNLWNYLNIRAKARTQLWAFSVHLHPMLMGSRGSNRWTASSARTIQSKASAPPLAAHQSIPCISHCPNKSRAAMQKRYCSGELTSCRRAGL
jgi:hypothetical protein